MRKGYILLEDGSATSSVTQQNSWRNMVDISGPGPGGLLFAVYFSPSSPTGLFTSCSSPGFTSTPALNGALESGLCSFSGNIGLEMCWLEHALGLAANSAKATGILLLLGVGGVICYKIYSNHKEKIMAAIRTILSPRRFKLQKSGYVGNVDDEQEADDEEDLFDLFEADFSVGLNCLSVDHRPKRLRSKGVYRAEQIRTRWRHVTSRPKPPSSAEYTPLPLRRHYSTPEGLVRLQDAQNLHKIAQDGRYVRLTVNTDSPPGQSSEEASPTHSYRFRSYSLSVKDKRFQAEMLPWSMWDGSMESFVSGADFSEVSRLIRECSVDSDCSEFSLDMSLNEGCGLSTLQVIERIEQEINSVKNNCLAMDQELHTLHDIRPQLTSSENELGNPDFVSQHTSRPSFKRLLNITAIQDDDTASITSDSSPSHHRHSIPNASEEDGFSMEWDNTDLLSSERSEEKANEVRLSLPLPEATQSSESDSQSGICFEVQESPASCLQESGYLEWDGTPSSELTTSFVSSSILSPLVEKRESDSMSCTTSSYSSCLTSPVDSFQESNVKRRQWSESNQQNRDSAIFDLGLDLEAVWKEEAVGLAVQIQHYANDTWLAPTARAHAIKQAYFELERMTGCKRMRRLRSDYYGILRATFCQMILKRIHLPKANDAIVVITRELSRGCDWIREWSFGHRLPYGSNNVTEGMLHCLQTMDLLVEELARESDPFETLVSRLNADLVLDTQLMEAIKIHVLSGALSLELAGSLGDALPRFALDLFSRPDSRNVKELSMNYLNPIGDSVTLNKMEYCLLGYSLGVRIDVFRPTAVTLDGEGNVDLRASYPEFGSFDSCISIIEEDERHYSVPVP